MKCEICLYRCQHSGRGVSSDTKQNPCRLCCKSALILIGLLTVCEASKTADHKQTSDADQTLSRLVLPGKQQYSRQIPAYKQIAIRTQADRAESSQNKRRICIWSDLSDRPDHIRPYSALQQNAQTNPIPLSAHHQNSQNSQIYCFGKAYALCRDNNKPLLTPDQYSSHMPTHDAICQGIPQTHE